MAGVAGCLVARDCEGGDVVEFDLDTLKVGPTVGTQGSLPGGIDNLFVFQKTYLAQLYSSEGSVLEVSVHPLSRTYRAFYVVSFSAAPFRSDNVYSEHGQLQHFRRIAASGKAFSAFGLWGPQRLMSGSF